MIWTTSNCLLKFCVHLWRICWYEVEFDFRSTIANSLKIIQLKYPTKSWIGNTLYPIYCKLCTHQWAQKTKSHLPGSYSLWPITQEFVTQLQGVEPIRFRMTYKLTMNEYSYNTYEYNTMSEIQENPECQCVQWTETQKQKWSTVIRVQAGLDEQQSVIGEQAARLRVLQLLHLAIEEANANKRSRSEHRRTCRSTTRICSLHLANNDCHANAFWGNRGLRTIRKDF